MDCRCICFQDLFDDVHAKLRAGRPGFHRGRYKVYQNHYHNIPASAEGEVGFRFRLRVGASSLGINKSNNDTYFQ